MRSGIGEVWMRYSMMEVKRGEDGRGKGEGEGEDTKRGISGAKAAGLVEEQG